VHVRITRAWDRGCAEAATRIDVKAVLGQGLDKMIFWVGCFAESES